MTPGELRQVERMLAEPDTRRSVRQKADILLDRARGIPPGEVADKHGISAQAVAKLVAGFMDRGRLRYLTSRVGRPPAAVPGWVSNTVLTAKEAARFQNISLSTVNRMRRQWRDRSNGPPATEIISGHLEARGNEITLTLIGKGFGIFPHQPPWFGTCPYFRVANSAQLGFAEYGYTGDYWRLHYDKWEEKEIRVSGLRGQPGDALVVALWNPQTGTGASWGGNVPGGGPRPVIEAVRFLRDAANCGLEIVGHGFGPSPFTGRADRLDYLSFCNWRRHGLSSAFFAAGFSGFQRIDPSPWTLRYEAWSDEKIVVSNIGDPNGIDLDFSLLKLHDPVTIDLWNSRSRDHEGPQTAWAGRFRFSD
ncbi:MAG: hypothetical protein ACHQZS_06080 [Candidatus Binatales bacterium]